MIIVYDIVIPLILCLALLVEGMQCLSHPLLYSSQSSHALEVLVSGISVTAEHSRWQQSGA